MLSDAMHPLKGEEAILVITEATEEGVKPSAGGDLSQAQGC